MSRLRRPNISQIKLFRVCKKRNRKIEPFLVDSASTEDVVIKGRQYLRPYSNYDYFETWEDAQQHMIIRAEKDIEQAKKVLDSYKSRLDEIKKMTKPEAKSNTL